MQDYRINEENAFICGYNLKTKIDPPPERNENLMWAKPIISAVGFLTSKAGAAWEISALTGVGALISFGLIAWGCYEAYTMHQYNSIEFMSLRDSFTNPACGRCAYIRVPSNNSLVVDASLDVVFYWILGPPNDLTVKHNLKITAVAEYLDYGTGELINVTTPINLDLEPDSNNSFDAAKQIQEGNHGEDPMLWLGTAGYDAVDFYKIYVSTDRIIRIRMTPPQDCDFDLYLYSYTNRYNPVASSTTRGNATEDIYYGPTTGDYYWFIKVLPWGGCGFYNLSFWTISGGGGGGGGCPTLFVWNGSEYVYETLLNIHAESDITLQHQIQQTLVRDGLFYELQLRELDNFTSHIDQVKLYAMDFSGEVHMCPLIEAQLNNTYVTLKLLFDDGWRMDLQPAETVNLKFFPTIPSNRITDFMFEINGYNTKIP